MKKILLAVVILFTAVVGTMVWAQTPRRIEKPQWVLEHERDHSMGRHIKKAKPVRKISGTAKRGAKQVSPLVLPKK